MKRKEREKGRREREKKVGKGEGRGRGGGEKRVKSKDECVRENRERREGDRGRGRGIEGGERSIILDMYNFLLHSVHTTMDCDRPFMDVQHFDGIVQREHICRVINGSQPFVLQLHTEGSGEVFIQQFT